MEDADDELTIFIRICDFCDQISPNDPSSFYNFDSCGTTFWCCAGCKNGIVNKNPGIEMRSGAILYERK